MSDVVKCGALQDTFLGCFVKSISSASCLFVIEMYVLGFREPVPTTTNIGL